MCPPPQTAPPTEINLYWSDEQIILVLDEYTPGSRLPNNVLADSSPYQYPPSNLPEGIWYLVRSNEKKEYRHGFWKARGDASKIYSNSMITGWRTTLEYFEGRAPHGQKTDWLMQEYKITQKELCDKDKPKESRLLCRVFLCSGPSSKCEVHTPNCKTIIEPKKTKLVASVKQDANIPAGQDSRSESKGERGSEVQAPPVVADNKPNSVPQALSDQECFLRGDYLELNDLDEDPESHSSSSQNSSCPSKSSDEYFDSSAFLRELEEEENNYMQGQQSSSRHSYITSVRPSDVVLQPASSGPLLNGSPRTDIAEGLSTGSSVHQRLTDKSVLEHTSKRHSPESRMEGTSNFHNPGTPAAGHKNSAPSGEKKAGSGRMNKLKTYFCFMAPF